MGLFFKKKIRNPVRGTAQVVGASALDPNATSQNTRLSLVVQAEGIPAFSTEFHCIAKASKWPYPGMTLPVTVDRDDPSRLRIEWSEVPKSGDVARSQAASMAAAMRGEPATPQPGAPGGVGQMFPGAVVNVQGQNVDPADPRYKQAMQAAEAATGMDLDGDGKVSGRDGATPAATPSFGVTAGDPNEERIEQLERLTKLRDSGALTPEEFEAQKKSILGS